MRRFRWIILIGELLLVVLALAVPPLDLPQTAFDEANTPINQATVPVVLSCRSALAGLSRAANATAAIIHPPQTHSAIPVDFRPQQRQPRSSSLLALLCSFLC